MGNDFLHKIDVNTLLKELGISKEELSVLAGISRASNLNKWGELKEKGGARPSYNTFVKLLEKGASVETLFGVEYKAGFKIVEKPIKITDADIGAFLQRAADALKKNPQ